MGRGGTPGLKPPEYVFERIDVSGTEDVNSTLSLQGANVPASAGKADGLLVMLGFGVAAFTPASYQRRRLRRPCET